MGRFDRKDRFYKQAKAEGRASRASYKLEQIQVKFHIVKPGAQVIDLGAAPGSWLEVLSGLVGKSGKVVGIDLLPLKISFRPNIKFFQEDIYDEKTISLIKAEIDQADLVASDMAPDTSGVKFRDSYLSYELAASALDIAKKLLKPGGNFVVKIFPGDEYSGFKKDLGKYFEKVSHYRPEATRKSSSEIYLVGMGFRALDPSTNSG